MSEPDVALALVAAVGLVRQRLAGHGADRACSARSIRIRAPTARFRAILRKYVREDHLLTLEEAIRKFTALPAQKMRLADRGVLKPGMWADVVVFDPDQIADKATFENPNQLSVGMKYVLVNGVPVIADGNATNALPGKVLRGASATSAGSTK